MAADRTADDEQRAIALGTCIMRCETRTTEAAVLISLCLFLLGFLVAVISSSFGCSLCRVRWYGWWWLWLALRSEVVRLVVVVVGCGAVVVAVGAVHAHP